jgi:hypothetical protein
VSTTVTLWTLPDCPRCDKVKAALRAGGFAPDEKDLRKLRSGEEPDVDAMTHLVMTGEVAPLVRVGDRFLEPDEVDGLIEGDDACLSSNCHFPRP